MKFLCPSCKAKYQISDEKIMGRTLKMDCRRCSHPIVIRGDKLAAAPAAQAAASARPAARARGGSHVGAAPSSRQSSRTALGADFRKNPAGAAAAPKATAPLEQWHVAINDVPVGPMRREEIAQKISAGSVRAESLCWREGFDEWRPLGEVSELADLLERAAPAAPPAPSRALSRPAPPTPRPARPPTSRIPPRAPRSPAESARPSARGNVVPLAGRRGAVAAPVVEDFTTDPDDEPTRVGSSLDLVREEERLAEEQREAAEKAGESVPAASGAPEPAAPPVAEPAVTSAQIADDDAFDPFASQRAPSPVAPPAPALEPAPAPEPAPTPAVAPVPEEPRRRGLPIGAWIAIAAAVPFGITLAVMVGMSMFPQPSPPVASNDPAPTRVGPSEPIEALPDPTLGDVPPTDEGEGSSEADPGDESGAGEAASPPARASAGKAPSAPRDSAEPSRPALDPEAAARLERFQDNGAGAATINVSNRNNPLANDRNTGGNELTSEQIRSVVNRERATVQRCYETATRAAGEAPGLRMDVDVVVGGSGTVTSATARGPGFGTLVQCIERTVRRWRFPATGATSRASIPFVFQGQD